MNTTTNAAHYASRFGFTLTKTAEGFVVEHWSGMNYAVLPSEAKALRCIEKARRISPELARDIMAEAGATDLGELRAAELSATTLHHKLTRAEAYTVLSRADMPEARAYFANLFK